MRSSVLCAAVCLLLAHTISALPVAQPDNKEVLLLEVVPASGQETLHSLDLGEPNSDISARDKRTVGFLRETFPGLSEEGSSGPYRRKARAAVTDDAEEDQETAATGDNEALPDQDAAAADDSENRDKRFLFGFGGGEAGGSGSAGGSGNFLFDIIRRREAPSLKKSDPGSQGTADRTARAAGSFYRMVAGTSDDQPSYTFSANPPSSSLSAHLSSSGGLVTRTSFGAGKTSSLIAGSGSTEESSDVSGGSAGASIGYSAGGSADIEVAPEVDKDDGYTSGIPGPITRLFVIANRGISNLIQDLILRLAQTSERIVNFKARLITSII